MSFTWFWTKSIASSTNACVLDGTPERALRLHDTVIGPGALLRRAALERAGGWDPSLRWIGDLILWMKLGLQGRAIRVPEILAWYRQTGHSMLSLTTLDATVGRSLIATRAPRVFSAAPLVSAS